MAELAMTTTVRLRNGVEIPQLGYGTFESSDEDVERGVLDAISLGYRHIDTAKAYGNEAAIGKALRAADIAREKLFLVTKVWMDEYENIPAAFEGSCKRLGVDTIDLLMLHWPGTDEAKYLRAYEGLLKLVEEKKIRAAGVSNFQQRHLGRLKQEFGAYPVYNQIQIHPWGQQRELCTFCRENEIALAAWGPLMHGYLKEATELVPIAEDYGVTAAQLVLRWHLQKGNIIFPKSVHKNRIAENCDLYHFAISPENMAKIDALERGWHWGPDVDTFNG